MRNLLLILALFVPAVGANAQAPELIAAYPAGGQRGTTVSLTLRGHNLQGATAVLVSGSGVRADLSPGKKDGDNLPLRLTIAPDAPLGPREIRVATPKGGSNPTQIFLDILPEIAEKEPNDLPSQPQNLAMLPVLINGTMDTPSDRDSFAFHADAGDTFVFDLNCWRHRSKMDGILELRDERGALLKLATAPWESDPRLIYTFPRAGRFVITVHDAQFQGGPNYTYRLALGKLPLLTDYQPRVARPGETITLTGNGVNLNGTSREQRTGNREQNQSQHSNYSITQLPNTQHPTPYSLPADVVPGEVCWIAPETPNGLARPIPLRVESLPAARVEAGKMLPPPPSAIAGRIEKPGEVQAFRFQAKAGQMLRFDVLAQRLGANMDSSLRILDANGKELAENDDGGTLLAGIAAGIGKDSRLEWKAPADGEYRVEISNLYGRGGPDCFYRLEITPVVPDFRLELNASKTDVARGGATIMTVVAERIGGFNGEIELHAAGLPPGVTCSGGWIQAGQNLGAITFAVEPGTALGLHALRVRGAVRIGDRTVEREAIAREQYLPRAIEPGMFTDDSYRQPYRPCLLDPLAITELAESFTLRADTTALQLAPGKSATFKIRATRKPGTDGEIKLSVQGLPGDYKADLKPIAAKTSETTITLTAPPNAPPSRRLTLIFVGALDKQTQVCPLLTVNSTGK